MKYFDPNCRFGAAEIVVDARIFIANLFIMFSNKFVEL